MRDVVHEGRVRTDDEDPPQLGAVRVQQERGPVEAHRRLAGSRAALDHERWGGVTRDQAVLVGLDRGDDVPHAAGATARQLLEQQVVHGGAAVETRERLVAEVEQAPAVGAEAAPQRDAVRCGGRGGVERARGRGLPVDDEDELIRVVHPAAPDVQRLGGALEVDAAEAEAALCIGEGHEPARGPGLERLRLDLAAARRRRPLDRLAHPVEAPVGVIDVRLLGGQLGVRHDVANRSAVVGARSSWRTTRRRSFAGPRLRPARAAHGRR